MRKEIFRTIILATSLLHLARSRIPCMDQLRKSRVTLYDSTAYVYEGSPLRVEKQLNFMLPLNISELLGVPEGYFEAARTLQQACDGALSIIESVYPPVVYTIPALTVDATVTKRVRAKRSNYWSTVGAEVSPPREIIREGMVGKPPMASVGYQGPVVDRMEFDVRRYVSYKITTVPIQGVAAKKGSLSMYRYQCEILGGHIPRVASYSRASRVNLRSFMVNNDIPYILLDTEYDFNTLQIMFATIEGPRDTLFDAFPEAYNNAPLAWYAREGPSKTRQYLKGQAQDAQPLWKQVLSPYAQIRYNKDGTLTPVLNRAHSITGPSWVVNRPFDLINVTAEFPEGKRQLQQHLPDTSFVCEIPKPKPPPEETEQRAPQQRQYLGMVQACYNTVASIEVEGANFQARLVSLFQKHHIPLPTPTQRQEEVAKRSSLAPLPRKRKKRFFAAVAPALMKGIPWLASFLISQLGSPQTSKVKRLAVKHAVKNTAPSKRRAVKTLVKMARTVTDNSMEAMTQANLGYGLWPFYDSRKGTGTLSVNQTKDAIIRGTKELRQHADTLRGLQVEMGETKEILRALALEIRDTRDELEGVKKDVQAIQAIVSVQHILGEAAVKMAVLNNEAQQAYEDVRSVLRDISANIVPSLFNPIVAHALSERQSKRYAVAPHPTRPVFLDPLITNGEMYVFGFFFLGTRDWELYSIHPLPRFYEQVAYTRKIEFRYALLDSTQTSYFPLTEAEMNQCKYSACPATGVKREVIDDLCTIRGMAHLPFSPDCRITEETAKPYLQVTQSILLYSMPEKAYARLNCHAMSPLSGNTPQEGIGPEDGYWLEGIGSTSIPEGCEFTIATPKAVSAYGPPLSIQPQRDLPEVRSQQLSILDRENDDEIVFHEEYKNNLTLMNHFMDTHRRIDETGKYVISIGSVTLATLTGVAATFAYLKKSRQTLSARQKDTTKDLGNTRDEVKQEQQKLHQRVDRTRQDTAQNVHHLHNYVGTLYRFLNNPLQLRQYLDGKATMEVPSRLPLLNVLTHKESPGELGSDDPILKEGIIEKSKKGKPTCNPPLPPKLPKYHRLPLDTSIETVSTPAGVAIVSTKV